MWRGGEKGGERGGRGEKEWVGEEKEREGGRGGRR